MTRSEIKLFANVLSYVASVAIVVAVVYIQKILFVKYIPTYGGVLASIIFIITMSYVVMPILLRVKVYRTGVKIEKKHERN